MEEPREKVVTRLVQWMANARSNLNFSPNASRGALAALWVLSAAMTGYLGLDLKSGLGVFVDVSLGAIAGALGFGAVYLLVRLGLWFTDRLPRIGLAAGLTAYIGMLYFWGISEEATWHISLGIVLGVILLGVSVYELIRGDWEHAAKLKRVVLVSGLVVSVGMNAAWITWFVHPGTGSHLLEVQPYQGDPWIEAQNPATPGSYPVQTLTYGSGTDIRRPEYGPDVDLVTKTVNAGSYVRLDGWKEKSREWYWGFGPEKFPLNGRVWYPEGKGPFPLVLAVHGNHEMNEFSDPGYAYLGELLASKGYIFVSVDENFLNGFITGGVGGENDARAWLLLKHLDLWEMWNGLSGSPFFNNIDMERIALIGHSRGGEAAALAAAFNSLTRYPNNARIRWDFDFGIRAVIAIAPTDQQFKPGGHAAALEDINYLVLQGAHDGDVSEFVGLRQYNRVSFSDPDSGLFKAALYIYQANHGQFNSVWGRQDLGIPRGQLLNVAPLLPEEQQRQIAAVMIAAFLDLTLKEEQAYLPVFQDYRAAGDWLPPTLYVNQYEAAGTDYVASFEEDYDVITASVEGGRMTQFGLTRWKEDALEFRKGRDQENHALLLGWNDTRDWFRVFLPEGYSTTTGLDSDDYLVFSLGDLRDVEDVDGLLDFSVVLEDAGGEKAEVMLSEVMPLLPQFPVRFTRLPTWEDLKYKNSTEPILQTFRIPLAEFVENNPDFSPGSLITITLKFDQVERGEIILDNLGFGP